MDREGLPLETLLRRLTETPAEFFAAPKLAGDGTLPVAALVHDTALRLGVTFPAADYAAFASSNKITDGPRLRMTALLCWVLAHPWFARTKPSAEGVKKIFSDLAGELAAQGLPQKYTTDGDRREELARLVLATLGFRPAGESVPQSRDRLASLNTAERKRVLQASRQAEERARALRAALAKKAAEESADKWTRE